jgi:hypothetical protein
MFGNFTYLAYTLIFTVPLIAFLWRRHGARLWQARRLIVTATALVTAFGFFVWPYGLVWKCWEYSPTRILGVIIFGTVLEDVVWWLCISFLFACTVTLLAQFEDEGKPLIAALLRAR